MASNLAKQLGLEEKAPTSEQPADAVAPQGETPPQAAAQGSEAQGSAAADEDAIALAAINRRRGTSYATLDEALAAPVAAPPQESEEEKKKKRDAAKMQFAFENNKFTKEEFERYASDRSKTPRELVYEEFAKPFRDKDTDEDDIQRRFAKLYGEQEDDDDEVGSFVKNKRAEDLKREAARILKNKHKPIYSLDKEFDEYVSVQEKSKNEQQQAVRIAKEYAEDVSDIFSKISSRKIKIFGELNKPETDVEIDVPFMDEAIASVKSQFLTNESLAAFMGKYAKGKSPELTEYLTSVIMSSLQQKTLAADMGFVAKSYHAKMMEQKKIGRNNLTPDAVGGGEITPVRKSRLAQEVGIYDSN